jgi:ElaB/YqjD/DUF883 family membrane-anchored ribosome-binding protein
MDNVFFDNPPVLQGNERTQLQQLSGYLYTISNKLNEALMTVSLQAQDEIDKRLSAAEQSEQPQITSLKILIIKTAAIVRTEMDEISTKLHTETEAVSSQVGTLNQTLDARIRATAEGVLQDYHYDQLVHDTQTNTVYRTLANQRIFSGLINDNPVEYGIAIGEGVTAYDAQGNPYLNQNAKCATFTMNRMSFWQGNVELAYFSSGKFYISNGEITNTLKIGNYMWRAMADNGMTLVRV